MENITDNTLNTAIFTSDIHKLQQQGKEIVKVSELFQKT